jgi:undecaprenyl-diphosphatase
MEETQSEPSPVESARRRLLRRLAALRLWRAQVRYGVVLLAFAVLAFFARANAYFAWDRAVAHWVQGFRAPSLDWLMYFVSYVGYGVIPYAIAAATALAFLAARRRSEAYALLLSTAGSGILNRTIKMLIARPRPAAPDVNVFRLHGGQSFPSGHVTFYVCYFGFLFFVAYVLLPKRTLARRVALTLTSLARLPRRTLAERHHRRVFPRRPLARLLALPVRALERTLDLPSGRSEGRRKPRARGRITYST